MNFGKLDRRIEIEKRVLSQDAAGGRVETWTADGKAWAEIITARGDEKIIANAERDQNTRQFRIRFRALDPATNRIIYQGRTWNITGITEEGRRSALVVTTTATSPD
jgi:SPP1 family predicted phage head-tail adaptor